MSALALRAALSAPRARPSASAEATADKPEWRRTATAALARHSLGEGGSDGVGAEPLGSKLMDLSSLLQGATHVFPVAAQDCVRTRRDHEFRVYVDRIVDLSQQQVLKRERAQTGELSVPPGMTLEELGTENRCLSTAPALL